jgi:hypothetical protein
MNRGEGKMMDQIAVPTQIVITITMDTATGAVSVNGPLENRMMFYGLLEIAKETCMKFNDAKNTKSAIVAPPPGLLLMPRN